MFPASLKDLCLGDGFNEGVQGVLWPPGLEKVRGPVVVVVVLCSEKACHATVGLDAFVSSRPHMPPRGVFEDTVPSLPFVALDAASGCCCARHPFAPAQLTFGRTYKQRVDSVEWPRGIEQLVFGQFFFSNHVPLHSVAWPKGCVVRAAGSTMCRS